MWNNDCIRDCERELKLYSLGRIIDDVDMFVVPGNENICQKD